MLISWALFGADSGFRVGWRKAGGGRGGWGVVSGFRGFPGGVGESFILARGSGAELSLYWIWTLS